MVMPFIYWESQGAGDVLGGLRQLPSTNSPQTLSPSPSLPPVHLLCGPCQHLYLVYVWVYFVETLPDQIVSPLRAETLFCSTMCLASNTCSINICGKENKVFKNTKLEL